MSMNTLALAAIIIHCIGATAIKKLKVIIVGTTTATSEKVS
jgi:hypothetical protein